MASAKREARLERRSSELLMLSSQLTYKVKRSLNLVARPPTGLANLDLATSLTRWRRSSTVDAVRAMKTRIVDF